MKSSTALIDDARRCAHLFRLGRDIEAALVMVDLVDAAAPLFSSSEPQQQAWTQVLGAVLHCQERQDWIGVADWLEYEMVDLLQQH